MRHFTTKSCGRFAVCRSKLGSVFAPAVLATSLLGWSPAHAIELVARNDSATDGSATTVCECFIPSDFVSSRLSSPCDGDVVGIQLFWKSVFGGGPSPATEFSLGLYAPGTFPAQGAALNNAVGGPVVISGPQLFEGVYNEFRFLNDGTTPISVPVTSGETFVASLEFLNDTTDPFNTNMVPGVVYDHDGCQANKNAAFTSGSWLDACAAGVTGDWVIRAIVDCEADSIPTLSEWSVAAMTLLLMTAGTVLFRMRSGAT